MKKKILTALYIVLVAGAAAFIVNELDFSRDIFGSERQIKYTLYIGLNDKDTNQPAFGHFEARQAMFMIVRKYTVGCTFYDAQSYWFNEGNKTIITENTLVCVIMNIKPEAAKSILDEALKVFHQNSILLETEEVRGAFYSN